MLKSSYYCLYSTMPSQEVAQNIAKALLAEKLVACINIFPKIQSFYAWEGELCESEEFLFLCKTKESCLDKAMALITSLHPYECPALIALAIEKGSPSFLNWIETSTVA